MFHVVGDGKPIRLFVGGLHGREGRLTEGILRELSKYSPKEGKAVFCNLSRKGKYISTLDCDYFRTTIGNRLLHLIHRYKPRIYLELHSYNPKYYRNLTHPSRKERKGVPALIELERGILMGSVSPCIRTREFQRDDFCFMLDVPSDIADIDPVVTLSRMVLRSRNRSEFLNGFRKRYREQIDEAERNFRKFYKSLEPF